MLHLIQEKTLTKMDIIETIEIEINEDEKMTHILGTQQTWVDRGRDLNKHVKFNLAFQLSIHKFAFFFHDHAQLNPLM